jgi:hypothetical protein
MIDVSVSAWKQKVDGYAPLVFEETTATRHPSDPSPSFTDAQHKIIESYVALVPKPERAAYLAAVDGRFGSGAPGTAAVKMACVAAALSYVSLAELHERGLAPLPTKAKRNE